MSVKASLATRTTLRRWIVPAVMLSLTAGMLTLPSVTQAALAVPQPALAVPQAAATISSGFSHTCRLEGGKAYCWGVEGGGALGDGGIDNSSVPVAVRTSGVLAGKTLTQISAGSGDDGDTCALDSAGAAYCWGSNDFGQLGNGTTSVGSTVPVAVNTSGVLAGKTLTQITTGEESETCALDSAGKAYCWGIGVVGQLGDGSTVSSSVPVAVDTSGVLAGKILTQIAAGAFGACALDSTGAAYCWGYGGDGELGDDSTNNSSVPVAVDTAFALAGKTLTQITAGEGQVCVLDAAGAAYCWGDDINGALGVGVVGGAAFTTPTPVDTAMTFTQLAAGQQYTCGLASTGAAYCWGTNFYGQFGDASTAQASGLPVAVDTGGVLAGKALTAITTGWDDTCAVDASGAAYCWGLGYAGALGNDTTGGISDVPVFAGPRAPTGAAAVPGETAATVSWRAPGGLDGGTLTGYTATASPGGDMCTTTGATTCIITGLSGHAGDGHYSIVVVAHTTVGSSGASAPVAVTVIPEPTGPIVSGYRTTKCVDDSADSSVNDTPVVVEDCNGAPEQNWIIEPDGTIRINGKCIDIYRDEKTNNAPVELYNCTGGANQQWHASNGTLVNPVSGKCLDDPGFNVTDGTQLGIYACDGDSNQQWQLP